MNDLKVKWDKVRIESLERFNILGFKVYICMFVLLDMFKGKFWDEVYIYFKLMIIDDVFVMYGLVNVNLCSMEVDSELNVCYELMWVI